MTLEDFCEDEMEHFFLFMNLDMGKQYILKKRKRMLMLTDFLT